MKSQRQAKIIEIITSREVETQEQLLEALNECGFRSTQATISRDIKELHIVKELTKFGTYRYAASAREVSGSFSARLNGIFKECVLGYDYSSNLVVVRTIPGLASAAGSAVDAMEMSFVLGTIAGDDTIFILCRTERAAQNTKREIEILLKHKD